MKISQELRSQMELAQKNPRLSSNGSQKFDSLMETQSQKLKEQELQTLSKNITAQGERVARYRSFRDLAKYKRMVKDFVQESVQYGMDLKHAHSWNTSGQNRKLTTVEAVDNKLIELTETVMEQEKKQISILDIIGEIKGLLVNLYT